jgi:multidrug efflux pump
LGRIDTPLFYVVIRALVERREARAAERAAAHAQPALENH